MAEFWIVVADEPLAAFRSRDELERGVKALGVKRWGVIILDAPDPSAALDRAEELLARLRGDEGT